jgi:hypothetical protein
MFLRVTYELAGLPRNWRRLFNWGMDTPGESANPSSGGRGIDKKAPDLNLEWGALVCLERASINLFAPHH